MPRWGPTACTVCGRDGSSPDPPSWTEEPHETDGAVIKTLVLILIAGLLGGTGHVMLAKGMKTIGDLTEAPTSRLGGMVGRVVSNPWVLFGVTLQAAFFFLYLTLLSRSDVSRVLLVSVVDDIVVALVAQLLVGVAVTPSRWVGIGFIVLGVFLVGRG